MKDEIRKMVLNNISEVKALLLSPRMVEVVTLLSETPKTSRDLSIKYSISVQNASQLLLNTFNKGYLCRKEVMESSGGYIYEYWSKYPTSTFNGDVYFV